MLKLKSAAVVLIFAVALTVSQLAPQPSVAEESINRDRIARKRSIGFGRGVAAKPKLGFFGTIFHLVLEQVNDTKSAYNQVSDLVNNQFTDDTTPKPAETDDTINNGTTETPKISRAEFLKILDRNLKGLRRLRDLEWREAWKDTRANLVAYKNEASRGKRNSVT